jgi:hypothetical protein
MNKAMNKWARTFVFPVALQEVGVLKIQFLQPENVPCRKGSLSQLQTWPQLTYQTMSQF